MKVVSFRGVNVERLPSMDPAPIVTKLVVGPQISQENEGPTE